MKRFKSIHVVLVALVLLVAVLAGCGAEPEPVDSAESAGSQETTTAGAETQPEPAQANETADAAESDATVESIPFESAEAIGMNLSWRVVGEMLEVELVGPTTGWIAVGFKPIRAMRGANIILGYVDGGETVLTDQFGVTMSSHSPDTELGGESHVEVLSGSEADGTTTISFRIPLDSGDEYDQAVAAGEQFPVILAYGPNGADDLTTYHANRAGIEIEL